MRIVQFPKSVHWPWKFPVRSAKPRNKRRILIVCGVLLAIVAAGLFGLHRTLTRPFGDAAAATVLVIGADEPEAGRSRSDTMMLVRIQLKPVRQVTVVSLPRDTRVRIPGHKGSHKLNASFSMGGADLTRRTVADSFGVTIDHTVVCYSAGLAKVIDALGGVTVDVPRAMNYDDNYGHLHIHLKPGEQHLNGEKAVGFVRFRHDAEGDIGRVRRQQMFVKAVAKQALNLHTLRHWGTVKPALEASFQTDLTTTQLAGLAYSLRGVSHTELATSTLPGRDQNIHGVSYYQADRIRTTTALAPFGAKLKDGAAPAAGGVTQTASTGIAVLNGSGRNGYGRSAARQLAAAGFHVVRVANAPAGSYPHTVLRAPDGVDIDSLRDGIVHSLKCGQCVDSPTGNHDGPLEVIIGNDFRPVSGL